MRHPMPKGYRITTQFSQAHPGTDYAPPVPGQTDCPCFAPENATVIVASSGTVEGNYVILQGKQTGKFYYFGHFSTRKVTTGQSIAEGTVIGILGKTGTATGIHTHCEVRNARNSTFAGKHNPEVWFNEHIGVINMNPSVSEVNTYFRAWKGRSPTPEELANHIAKPWAFLADVLLLDQKATLKAANAKIAELEANPAQAKLDQIKQIVS